MKIARIAPLYESVPPRLYGGTERVVSYLTEELVRQGHDVTLFASGDSKTSAKLVPCSDLALRTNPAVTDPVPYHIIMLEEVRRRANEFDILHFHIDFLHASLVHDFKQRTLTTLHGRLDLPHIAPFYRFFRELPLVAVCDDQRNYRRSTGREPFTMVCLAISCRSNQRSPAGISLSSAESRPKSDRITQSKLLHGPECR
jgi:glycosyltransferase involved in cell wall biosynthesis